MFSVSPNSILSPPSQRVTQGTFGDTPMNTQATPKTLQSVENLQDFVKSADGQRFFCSLESLRWFLRINRESLIKAGALIKISRQVMIVRPEFDDAVIRLMREKALASLTN